MLFTISMNRLLVRVLLLFLALIAALQLPQTVKAQNDQLQQADFSEVRKILSENCFACHGPDEHAREADLRLDIRDGLVESEVVVAGKPDQSLLMERVLSSDPDEVMPPPSSGQLTETDKQTLRNWIKNGANYEEHWAFVPPKRPQPPIISTLLEADSIDQLLKNQNPKLKVSEREELEKWAVNSIDHFVLRKLLRSGLLPSRRANRYALIRRVYLDLIGLPPTPEEADIFANSKDPQAYEKVVDKLLQSKHYGEKWAREWLDLARYADTNGYEKDRPRSIWPYRDWVIKAINNDMPYDQFSIEQLAGDMLPNAKNSQKVATGFHRNTMLNEEGGIDPLEYRFYAMVDRVATTGTVWLGLTTGCAQCHTHKYDPISHTDYYKMMALLNNADEPDLEVLDDAVVSRRNELNSQIEKLESNLALKFPAAEGEGSLEKRRKNNLDAKFHEWLKNQRKSATRWRPIAASELATNLPKLQTLDDYSIFASGDFTKRDVYSLQFPLSQFSEPIRAIRLEVLPDSRLPAGGPGNAYYEGRKGDFFLSELTARADNRQLEFKNASTTYGKISIGSGSANGENVYDNKGSTGWSTSGKEGERNVLVLQLAEPVSADVLETQMIFERHFVASLGRFRISVTSDESATASLIPASEEFLLTEEALSTKQLNSLRNYFLKTTPLLKETRSEIEKLKQKQPTLPVTMVMREREVDNPRKTFRYHRGEYLNPREEVTGQLPELFTPFPDEVKPNRLEFAKWLVSEQNPLAARVAVNRDWQSFFGTGLVTSPGDFGTQSDPPTHPDLLDWLAIEFQENGWSRKKLHRLIVMSSTYHQSAIASENDYQSDPKNQLYARGPRFRVRAEVVRDLCLKACGKLSTKMYGPSVYPPQPGSVTALAYGSTQWRPSKGEDRYRRSIYTFSKRTAPFAAYQVFDGPSGENCTARRNRSTTPLQALTMLNDELFFECAVALAKLSAEQKFSSEKERAQFIFRQLSTRPATENELKLILEFKQQQLTRFQESELNSKELKVKELIGKDATPETAAWILVARALMNLDEVITKS